MADFFNKASSFLSSQANDQNAPSSGRYGDQEEHPPKAPAHSGAGRYGDLIEGAQSLMATTKPNTAGGGKPDIEKEGDGVGEALNTGGHGDLSTNAEKMMGSAKPGTGESKNKADAPKTTSSSGNPSSGDMYASAQVLMGAVKSTHEGGQADMGEVAGAASNLIGAGARYGDLEKTAYGEYAHKAQTYLQDYQASHGKASHRPSSTDNQGSSPPNPGKIGGNVTEEKEEAGSNPSLRKPVAKSGEGGYN